MVFYSLLQVSALCELFLMLLFGTRDNMLLNVSYSNKYISVKRKLSSNANKENSL